MRNAYFLTGTDTEIGKTFITCALLHRARLDGQRALGLKPIAAGTDAEGRNDDVERIRAANSVELPETILNPYCFAPPIAPHIAAAEAGLEIDFKRIEAACTQARQQADLVIVEGAGGFCVPLGVDRDSADLAVDLGLPVILVVGLRLGCINHALLTAEAIIARGLPLAGWIGNSIDPAMSRRAENLETLQQRLPGPCLGIVEFQGGIPDSRLAATSLRLPPG